jgi:hypothetical protein
MSSRLWLNEEVLSMSKYNSRKVWMWVINTILFWSGFFITVLTGATSQVAEMFSICIAAQVLCSFAFVGGMVWSSYIKSKWYRPELDESARPPVQFNCTDPGGETGRIFTASDTELKGFQQ